MTTMRGQGPSRQEAEALRHEAMLAHAEFLDQARAQPPEVADHSITRDLDRAFGRLVDQLTDVTGAPPPSLARGVQEQRTAP